MKEKKVKTKYKSLPNEFHRQERWSGGRVQRNRKKYTRKNKHKSKRFDY